MGIYTAHSEPIVDRTIKDHLALIVAAVRSRMRPQSIILRGSFGRGEGSVLIQDGRLHFLSDYEIDIATYSPFYRSLFAKLSHQLTVEFGVETNLRWVRPDYMYTARLGPLPTGSALTTIALYESRYGSRTIYGRDIIRSSPPVDPRQISLSSGINLVLNRMAESLYYMPRASDPTLDDWKVTYWVSKMILACAESLLLVWGQYHYKYKERGHRFVAMANDRLDSTHRWGTAISKLVQWATEFKLRPRCDLDTVRGTWEQIIPICDNVFRHLAEQALNFSFSHYVDFPEHYLKHAAGTFRLLSPMHACISKSLDMYRYLRKRRFPRGFLLPYNVSEVVYAVVPLLFVSWASDGETMSTMLSEVRRQLTLICPLKPPEPAPRNEWNALSQHMLWAWKNFCW